VYFILSDANYVTQATFFVDGTSESKFLEGGRLLGTGQFKTDELVYSTENLSNGFHTLQIQGANSKNNVFILFDYAEFV
jgi:hypothetical protein